MVPAIGIGTLLTLGSVLGQTFGLIKSGQEAKKQQGFLNQRRSELDDWYNKEYSTPYLQTDQAKSALSVLRTNIDRYQKRVAGRAAATGASDEAVVAANQGANEAMAGASAEIAGQGTAYKEGIRREKVVRDSQLDQEQGALDASQRGKWINYMSNAANLAGAGMAGESTGAFDGINSKISDWSTRRKAAKSFSTTLNQRAGNSLSSADNWLSELAAQEIP